MNSMALPIVSVTRTSSHVSSSTSPTNRAASTLAFCTPIADYFSQAFLDESLLKPRFVPLFRVMPSGEYAEKLLSDRRHMRDEYGWLVEPPPWPPTSITESNLHKFTDMSDADYGQILTAAQLL